MIKLPPGDWRDVDYSSLIKKKEKSACVVRYGGFGDMIMMSSVLPELKKQGYHITLNVSELGYPIIKTDPHVDRILVQVREQVKNDELIPYWEELSKYFDKFVNLSESVERNLLLHPEKVFEKNGTWTRALGDSDYLKSHEFRHAKYNKNYMEETHRIAGVPFSHNPNFFPTKKERSWAKQYKNKIKQSKVVLWVLSGSSVHKSYPHMDLAIFNTLRNDPDLMFVLVGDVVCKILEAGLEDHPRIHCRSGEWNIRKTLSFAQIADVVVGPETGVMNAVSACSNKKIVFLSHSSVENLSKHWINTTSLFPEELSCYPCHRMHFGFRHCNQDEKTGAAKCAALIHPREVMNHILIKEAA